MTLLFFSVFTIFLNLWCVQRCQSFNVTDAFEKCVTEIEAQDRPIVCSLIPEYASHPRQELALDLKCISKDIVRIKGNYSTLILRCESKIAITYDYDGVQPTEAFRVNFWKNVLPKTNGSQFTYVVDVEISSNLALRRKYGHLVDTDYSQMVDEMKDDRVYSRSGKYIIRGMWNANITKSIYFFIEENSKITFLQNSQTQFHKLLSPDALRIPCRPSHFDATVLLFHNNEKLAESSELNPSVHYSPEVGFTVDLNTRRLKGNESFICQLKSGSKEKLLIDAKESVQVLYGFESELLFKDKSLDSNILFRDIRAGSPQGVQQWKHSLSCGCGDSLNVEINDPLEFQAIETDNPAHTRLLREFVIPRFANRSFLLKKGFRRNEESIIENLNTHVIAYCGNSVSYNLAEHGTALHFQKPLLKGYAFDWVNLKRRTAPNELYISIKLFSENPDNDDKVFYAKNNYTFVCETLRFTQAATVIWYTQRNNGALVEEKIVDKMTGSDSSWTTQITNDVSKVICSTSLWYDDNWKFAELKTITQNGSSPQIMNIVKDQVIRVPKTRTNNNQVLDCLSQGKPPPEVYWRKNGMKLKANILKVGNFSIRAIIKLSEISTDNLFGEYECVASNFKDRTMAKIRVKPLQDVQVWNSTTYFLVIGFPLIVFLCTAMAAIVYIRYFRKPSIGLTRQEIQAFRLGTTLTLNDGNSKNEYVDNISKQPYNKNYEVTRKNFIVYLNEVLGSGAYGMVCKGSVNGTEVAVKTLNALAGKQYLKALLSELKVMLYLGRHENIVQLVGAYTELLGKGKIYVFMELCSLGNLESYLRKYQKDLQGSNVLAYVNSREAVEMEEAEIIQQLDDWACHIATGLSHLNLKKVIHGDLAARNILLSSTKIAKITDFGLSRRLYDYADYVKKQQEPLPWRWMAIESLQNLTFSVDSDIWSFGVLLWEIFSLGEVPYPGMSWNAEFLGNLKKGMRICKPDLASQSLYESIILECWRINPKERPTPEKIVAFFKSRSGLY